MRFGDIIVEACVRIGEVQPSRKNSFKRICFSNRRRMSWVFGYTATSPSASQNHQHERFVRIRHRHGLTSTTAQMLSPLGLGIRLLVESGVLGG